MKNLELYQVALEPGSVSETEMAALYLNHRQYLNNKQRFKLQVGKLIHPLGIHHWVGWKTWDRPSNRVITMGVTCAFCELGSYR